MACGMAGRKKEAVCEDFGMAERAEFMVLK